MKDQCRECYWSFYCPEKSRGIACTDYKEVKSITDEKNKDRETQRRKEMK